MPAYVRGSLEVQPQLSAESAVELAELSCRAESIEAEVELTAESEAGTWRARKYGFDETCLDAAELTYFASVLAVMQRTAQHGPAEVMVNNAPHYLYVKAADPHTLFELVSALKNIDLQEATLVRAFIDEKFSEDLTALRMAEIDVPPGFDLTAFVPVLEQAIVIENQGIEVTETGITVTVSSESMRFSDEASAVQSFAMSRDVPLQFMAATNPNDSAETTAENQQLFDELRQLDAVDTAFISTDVDATTIYVDARDRAGLLDLLSYLEGRKRNATQLVLRYDKFDVGIHNQADLGGSRAALEEAFLVADQVPTTTEVSVNVHPDRLVILWSLRTKSNAVLDETELLLRELLSSTQVDEILLLPDGVEMRTLTKAAS